jgi:glutathione peroxidase
MGTKAIKWNFTKFLIGKDGKAIERYGSSATPEQIAEDIKKIL